MWFDMKEGIGLGGIYFKPVNGEPTPTLAIFSWQLRDKSLSMSQLPPEFAQDLSQWEMVAAARDGALSHFRERQEICTVA